jgi:hypothetical protein
MYILCSGNRIIPVELIQPKIVAISWCPNIISETKGSVGCR